MSYERLLGNGNNSPVEENNGVFRGTSGPANKFRGSPPSGNNTSESLKQAIENNDFKRCRLILERDNINVESLKPHLQSLMSSAAHSGKSDIVKILIEKKYIDVNERFSYDVPLTCAVRGGYISIVEYLINKGANVNVIVNERSRGGPLLFAIYLDYLPIVKLLVSKGANIEGATPEHKRDLIHGAVARNNINMMKFLVDNLHIDIGSFDEEVLTELYKEAKGEQVKSYLVEHGAKVPAQGGRRRNKTRHSKKPKRKTRSYK